MEQAISVAQLNRQAKFILEQNFGQVLIHGELSNLSRPQSGHVYFTLKDNTAQVRCAFFKGQAMRQTYRPQEGEAVLVSGKVSLFEGRGDYQVLVSSIQPAGDGALQIAFEALKKRLQAEGLFAQERKRALPSSVSTVAVITSATGAALQDILQVLRRRDPFIEVLVYPCLVQGKEAALDIRRALAQAIQDAASDVIIVGRGGGSSEDLWSFNDEGLARDIAASPIPVVSAVGHEVDFTIADFVADVRAPTPSAAAELVSADHSLRAQQLTTLARRLSFAVQRTITTYRQRLHHTQQRLRHPADRIREQQQRLDNASVRLERALQHRLQQVRMRLHTATQRVERASPQHRLPAQKQQLNLLQQRLLRIITHRLERWRSHLTTQAHSLHTASPLATLQRGYSITQDEQGKVVTSAKRLAVGQTLTHRLADGQVKSTVTDVILKGEKPR
ncbi:exodeoxyribonuclease VII large subunit [Salinispirillum marinum]|uniref:Exodeoxyribonuclease 7 large subunit n=2 Tax=Saccharospirillaceae TaxID=255527 RepID=A0ABV8BH27_9GAMM